MFRIFLTNLGKYNEGELVGEWVDLPVDDDFEKAFADIGIGTTDEFGQPYEEWFITDYENDYGYSVGEYDNIYELNEIAEKLEGLSEDETLIMEAYLENVGDDIDEALQVIEDNDYYYFYDCRTMEDVATAYVDDLGGVENAVNDPENYFDYDMYGRDIRTDMDDMAYESWEEDEHDEDEEFESPYDDMSDYELGAMAVDDFYGGDVSEVPNADYYFDYESFGDAMSYDGTFVFLDNGDCVEFLY